MEVEKVTGKSRTWRGVQGEEISGMGLEWKRMRGRYIRTVREWRNLPAFLAPYSAAPVTPLVRSVTTAAVGER